LEAKRLKKIIIFFFSFLIPTILYAQTTEIKLSASDGTQIDFFGGSVSLSNDYMIVGAIRAETNGVETGAAYIFKNENNVWIEKAKLTASDTTAPDGFGGAVAIYDDYAVVGFVSDDENGRLSGSAYVYKREGEAWIEKTRLLPADGDEHDRFGTSISLYEDYVLIGASDDDENGQLSGSAYMFMRNGDTWTESAKLLPSDASDDARFGSSVALTENLALIGAPTDDTNVNSAGAVYVFLRQGSTWTEQTKLVAADLSDGIMFGLSVSIHDTLAIIGAIGNNALGHPGAAYVFRQEGMNWVQEDKLEASDGENSDGFGESVSIYEDYALIGARDDLANGWLSGSAYVFRRQGKSWVEEVKLIPSDGFNTKNFGRATVLAIDQAFIGAPHAADTGSVYIYSGFYRDILLDISIDPLYQPVPMAGDTFPLDLAVRNTTADIQNLEFWTTVYKPNGTPLGPSSGPFSIKLQPIQTTNVQDILEITGPADAGIYKVISRVGSYPDTVVHIDSTIFRKLGPGPAVSNPIADLAVFENFGPTVIASLDTIFSHPGGSSLTYSAQTDGNTIAILPSNLLRLRSIASFTGTSEVIVTASDEQPVSISDTFYVTVQPVVGVEEDPESLTRSFQLLQNYPNPFNPTTTIAFNLPATQKVNLTIFSLNGERVKTLISQQLHSGEHQISWDGTNSANQRVSSGIYLYRLSAENYTSIRKMALLR